MMITVNRVGDYLTGTIEGKGYSTPYNDEKFSTMKKYVETLSGATTLQEVKDIVENFRPLTMDSYKEFVEDRTPFLHVNRSTGEYFLHHEGVYSKYPLPGVFVKRIIKAIDTNNDLNPLIKAAVRFMRNHLYTYGKFLRFANYLNLTHVDQSLVETLKKNGVSPEMAVERATLYQTNITREGLLLTYKVSREITEKYVKDADGEGVKQVQRYDYEVDEFSGIMKHIKPEFVEDLVFEPVAMGQGGDPFYCDDYLGHIIRVGRAHFLDSWDKVNCNDNSSCVAGLHVGNLDYIRGYQNQGTATHNVFIDPMDIGAITNDGSGAIRVRRYFVHSSFYGINRGFYNSSQYAALTDAEYDKMVEEAVDAANAEAAAAVAAAKAKIAQINLTKSL